LGFEREDLLANSPNKNQRQLSNKSEGFVSLPMEPLVAWGSVADLAPVESPSVAKRHPLARSLDDAVRRASLLDMDRVRLIKGEPHDLSSFHDDAMLEQLLVDDPLVATLAAAQQFGTSSEDESHSDTAADPKAALVKCESSESLVEVAQAAVVSVADATCEDEIGLTPLEIRRKRNRESMQRARARQRSDIASMKVAMRQLEAHFQKLSEQREQQRIHNGSATSALQVAGAKPIEQVETEYRQLADASRRLKEEKFLLEKMLTEKTKTFRRFQQAMVDRTVELNITTPLTGEAPSAASPQDPAVGFFTPITELQADAAIKRCYEDIERLEKMSKPLRNADGVHATAPALPPSSTFGWSMLCHILPDDGGFFAAFTKSFPHVTPDETMLQTWTLYSRPENNAGSEKRNGVMRMDTLQVVNDNAYVAYRDVQHPSRPGKTLRTMFLRFRLQTEHGGYVIGRACMNPTNPELRALDEREGNIVYGDYSSWIEFRAPRDGTPGCEVKFGAVLAYNTQEDLQLRLINALMTTIMWETTVIKPLFCFPPNALN
jgi:hypothetical protein